MSDLSRKRDRDRLPLRREPYWQRLAAGAYLGFRRGPDTWICRYRSRNGKQLYRALGEGMDYRRGETAASHGCLNSRLRQFGRFNVEASGRP